MNTIEKQAEEYCLIHAEKDWGLVYAAYLAGASAMNGSAGVWVKASDRLPENMKEVFIKYSYQGKKDTAIGKCNTLFPMKNWVHKNGIPLTFDQLEWLDTSVSSPSPQPLATSYQKCPKCDGQGSVSKPPWLSGDIHQWSSTAATFVCDVCNGAKIIPTPFSPSPLEAETADKKRIAELEAFKKSVFSVLDENYQAQIAGFYNHDKTSEERDIRNAVIEEYKDLIQIFKARLPK